MTHFRIARPIVASMVACLLITLRGVAGQEFRIGIVDLYGLNRVAVDHVRGALTFKEGDPISFGVTSVRRSWQPQRSAWRCCQVSFGHGLT